MANGTAVRLRALDESSSSSTSAFNVAAEPGASTPAKVGVETLITAGKSTPPFDQRLGGGEAWVGAILIGLAVVSARALHEAQEGELSAETKALGGDLLARLHALSQHMPADFADVVRRQARLQLRGNDAAVDEILKTVARVDRAVRAQTN